MLLLAVVALLLPAMYLLARGGELPQLGEEATNFPSSVEHMSFAVAIVLLMSYFAGLWFSLKTHRDVFNPDTEDEDAAAHAWSIRKSVGLLAGAGVAVGFMSEILVGSIEEASEGIGLSPFFVSLIIVAIVGNAAEHWVAVYFAARNKMDIAIAIAIGSSAQIALFVMPVLVLLSFVIGPFPLVAGVQRAGAGGDPARGADRRHTSPRTANRPGSRACSCSRSTSSWASSSTSCRPRYSSGSGSSSSSSSTSSSSGSSRAEERARRVSNASTSSSRLCSSIAGSSPSRIHSAPSPPRPRSARGRRGRNRRRPARSRSLG